MKYFLYIMLIAMVTVSCRRGSGCPAQEAMQQASQDPTKLKKQETRSSVAPAQVKYNSKKNKKK
jgi:hypothetical protein